MSVDDGDLSDRLTQARTLFSRALEHQKKGSLDKAESLYREALELAPDRPSIINNLVAVLLAWRKYSDAGVLVREAS